MKDENDTGNAALSHMDSYHHSQSGCLAVCQQDWLAEVTISYEPSVVGRSSSQSGALPVWR